MDNYARKQNQTIKINYSAAQEHVPRAEQNNRTIKEQVQSIYYQLPYKHLLHVMVKYLVSEAARKLNYFPNKNGVSKHYSPQMILYIGRSVMDLQYFLREKQHTKISTYI